jgi:hypothetical protein
MLTDTSNATTLVECENQDLKNIYRWNCYIENSKTDTADTTYPDVW